MPGYAVRTGDINAPSSSAYAIVPSNSVDQTPAFRRLFVGGGGAVSVKMLDGSTVVFTGIVSGTTLEIRGTRVNVTGTTATNMVGLV